MNLSSLTRLCLVLLVFLTPRVGLATNLEGTLIPSNTRSWSEQASPETWRLVEEPGTSAPVSGSARPARPHAALRIAAELGAGVLTGVGLAYAGTLIGGTQCPKMAQPADSCVLYPLAGMWMGSSLGFALGVWWGGSLLGGQGSILHTLGGMALGMLLGVGAFLLYDGYINPVSGIALLMPYPLSVAAFELSSSTRLQPLVTVSRRGDLMMGLAGSF